MPQVRYSVVMLEGMTAVLAAFFVFCLAKQELIRNRTYYYATFVCLLLIILFNVFYYFTAPATSFQGFCAIGLGVLHAAALILTMAYIGGLSIRQMADEMKDAAQDFRTAGESRKPVIVPLGQDKPRVKDAYEEEEREQREKPRIVIELPKKDE